MMKTNQLIHHPLIPEILGYAKENDIRETKPPDGLQQRFQSSDMPKASLTQHQFQCLSSNIQETMGKAAIGLHIGKGLRWSNLGIIGYIVVNSRIFNESLQRYKKYYSQVSNITQFDFVKRSDTIELCWKLVDDEFKGQYKPILEGVLASLKPLFEEQTGKEITAKEIQFCWPKGKEALEYEQYFDTRLTYNGSCAKAVFDRSIAELPCKLPNSDLLSVLENFVRDRGHQAKADQPHSTDVLNILKNSKGKILNIDQVADRLGTSVRNLQFRLKKEGTTFRLIRDQALYEQARILLASSEEPVEQISNRLGFSEPAVFYKSFKRWAGRTPRGFRRNL